MMRGFIGSEAAIRGVAQRTTVLPFLLDPPVEASVGDGAYLAWSNNWADWDNSGGHNEWDNGNPNPPGGKR